MSFVWSLIYLAAMAAVALTLQTGYLLAGDGFFLAASIVAVFTGHWVIAADSAHEAPVATTRFASAGLSYALCLGIAGLVTVQAVASL
jgi:hypothetical protein